MLLIYDKYSEIYDKRATLGWNLIYITSVVFLKDKIVMDADAGIRKVAFKIVKDSYIVFVVKYCANIRQCICKKAKKIIIINLMLVIVLYFINVIFHLITEIYDFYFSSFSVFSKI